MSSQICTNWKHTHVVVLRACAACQACAALLTFRAGQNVMVTQTRGQKRRSRRAASCGSHVPRGTPCKRTQRSWQRVQTHSARLQVSWRCERPRVENGSTLGASDVSPQQRLRRRLSARPPQPVSANQDGGSIGAHSRPTQAANHQRRGIIAARMGDARSFSAPRSDAGISQGSGARNTIERTLDLSADSVVHAQSRCDASCL